MTTALYLNFCKWASTTSGTGAFTVGAAAATDDAGSHDTPENSGVINGNVYRYFAQVGSQTELGRGAYNTATHTLARTTVLANSDGTNTPVNFASPPTVDIYPAPVKTLESAIASGTVMLFWQATAPIGWTKLTTQNDKLLRVVSGAGGGVGGSTPFSTFNNQTPSIGNTTIGIGTMPSHDHPYNIGTSVVLGNQFCGTRGYFDTLTGSTTGATGSGGAHGHSIALTLAVQFIDLILASKN